MAGPAVRLTGAGGTDPHRWPLQVSRRPGEALHGWLWRLSYRYGLTPRATLRLFTSEPQDHATPR